MQLVEEATWLTWYDKEEKELAFSLLVLGIDHKMRSTFFSVPAWGWRVRTSPELIWNHYLPAIKGRVKAVIGAYPCIHRVCFSDMLIAPYYRGREKMDKGIERVLCNAR